MSEWPRRGSIIQLQRSFDCEPEMWIYDGEKLGPRSQPQLVVLDLASREPTQVPFAEIERIELVAAAPPLRRRRRTQQLLPVG